MSTNNSYTIVCETLKITVEALFDAGLKNIIWLGKNEGSKWEELKYNICNKCAESERIYVRSHGKNGNGNDKMLKILKDVFKMEFETDKTNNSQPKRVLNAALNAVKGEKYEDYQISHIFEERTNNPLLFTAPWMICYTPKIIDPFTGHETKGFPQFRDQFIEKAYEINKEFINDYNNCILPYWVELKGYIDKSDNNDYNDKFNKHMIATLAPIIKEYEKESDSERRTNYLNLFNHLNENMTFDNILEFIKKNTA